MVNSVQNIKILQYVIAIYVTYYKSIWMERKNGFQTYWSMRRNNIGIYIKLKEEYIQGDKYV